MSMAGSQSPLDQEEQKRILNLIKDFVGERLRRNGIHIAGYEEEEIINSEDRNINEIALTLRRVGDELELADAQFVQNMCTRLQVTPNTAYSMFQGISDKIFISGKNWGRIVAFLTFGSSLAVHCAVNPEMGHRYVDRIVDWINVYMTTKLGPWIVQHGGWNGFMEFFHQQHANQSQQNGFLVSAIAGVGLGAFLMMTFK